jgi:hypothetical protein
MISALNSIIVCGLFGKILSVRNPQKSSHMGLNQDYSAASSVHMRNDQEVGPKDKIGVDCWCSGVGRYFTTHVTHNVV